MNASELPQTALEAITYFADMDRAHAFAVAMRWPDGIRCVHCNSDRIGKLVMPRRIWNCLDCRKQFTVKKNTIFEDSPLGLDKWLSALWILVNAKNGVSSCELHRSLGITQKSAWFVAHRLRKAIQQGTIVNLGDGAIVEVDESWIGGEARGIVKQAKKAGKKFNPKSGKSIVLGMLERGGGKRAASRVVTEIVPSVNRGELIPRVRKYVLKGATIHTDQHGGYYELREDFTHKVVNHTLAYVHENVHTNGIENFWCLLKRTIRGTYVHCEPFHLARYLDEQTYRFNERREDDQGRFLRAMRGVAGRRLTWQELTGKPIKTACADDQPFP